MRALAVVLWICLASASAHAAPPDWQVRVTPWDRIYPALDVSQARRARSEDDNAFGSGAGLVAVRVRAQHDGETVELAVAAPELARPAQVRAQLPQAGRDYLLRPALAWDVERLRALADPRASSLRFTLARDGSDAGTRDVAVSLRPLSEALYFVRDGSEAVDLSWIFAAYVDEHDAVVDAVLAAALESGIVDKFDGYAAGEEAAVQRQAWAVWHALAAHGIRYSPADPGIERGPRVFSQRVRLLEETWSDRSATCIDGSVLIASVLQRIGLRTFLVLVPGHALVGYYTGREGRHAAWLETTVLGAPAPVLRAMPAFAGDFDVDDARRLDLPGFAAALAAGSRRYARAAPRFDRAQRPDYAIIDIGQAREFGIRAIGSVSGER
jgi:hypothetical protein